MRRRDAFFAVADLVVPLVEDERVNEAWLKPSALPQMSVGGLATHLAGQVVSVHAAVAAPVASSVERPINLMSHYARAAWVNSGLEDEANRSIREGAERSAEDGHAAVVERLQRSLAALRKWPADAPTTVRMPWWDWSLSMEDFLLTRMMEMMVHSDDLAVSLSIETPHFPRVAARPVLTMLTTLAERRHGQPAVLRALTRGERAPASITAF